MATISGNLPFGKAPHSKDLVPPTIRQDDPLHIPETRGGAKRLRDDSARSSLIFHQPFPAPSISNDATFIETGRPSPMSMSPSSALLDSCPYPYKTSSDPFFGANSEPEEPTGVQSPFVLTAGMTAFDDDYLLPDVYNVSGTYSPLIPLDSQLLSFDERVAVYEFYSDAIGPAKGIQESLGTYMGQMKERSRYYFSRLISRPHRVMDRGSSSHTSRPQPSSSGHKQFRDTNEDPLGGTIPVSTYIPSATESEMESTCLNLSPGPYTYYKSQFSKLEADPSITHSYNSPLSNNTSKLAPPFNLRSSSPSRCTTALPGRALTRDNKASIHSPSLTQASHYSPYNTPRTIRKPASDADLTTIHRTSAQRPHLSRSTSSITRRFRTTSALGGI